MAIVNIKNKNVPSKLCKLVDFCGGDIYPAITMENKLPLIAFLEGDPWGMELEELKDSLSKSVQVSIRFDRVEDIEKCIEALKWAKNVLVAFETYNPEHYKH